MSAAAGPLRVELERDPSERYVIYVLRGGELHEIGTAETPAGVGCCIVQTHEDQKAIGRRLADLGVLGVRDAHAGEWIVLPWQRRTEEPSMIDHSIPGRRPIRERS